MDGNNENQLQKDDEFYNINKELILWIWFKHHLNNKFPKTILLKYSILDPKGMVGIKYVNEENFVKSKDIPNFFKENMVFDRFDQIYAVINENNIIKNKLKSKYDINKDKVKRIEFKKLINIEEPINHELTKQNGDEIKYEMLKQEENLNIGQTKNYRYSMFLTRQYYFMMIIKKGNNNKSKNKNTRMIYLGEDEKLKKEILERIRQEKEKRDNERKAAEAAERAARMTEEERQRFLREEEENRLREEEEENRLREEEEEEKRLRKEEEEEKRLREEEEEKRLREEEEENRLREEEEEKRLEKKEKKQRRAEEKKSKKSDKIIIKYWIITLIKDGQVVYEEQMDPKCTQVQMLDSINALKKDYDADTACVTDVREIDIDIVKYRLNQKSLLYY